MPSSTRRDAGRPRGKSIHDAVLRATLDDIAAHGAEAISVDRIARAADVNKTTVYRRWPTLNDLTAAALRYAATQMSATLSPSGTLAADLQSIARIVGEMLSTSDGQAIVRAGLSSTLERPTDASLAAAIFELPDELGQVVGGAMARGEWDLAIGPDVVLAALVGGIIHRTMIERQPADPVFLGTLVQLLLTGIGPRPQPE